MNLVEKIDAILPQTQCELCGFKGCRPYAEALARDSASIDLCPPGGVKGLLNLATLLQKNPEPFISGMKQKEKPPLRAVIREAECIGCTKCIQACPVDAILGAGKSMHTVIANECTGCELCVAPCPVDCIDMVELPEPILTQEKSNTFRMRFLAREKRLQQEKIFAEKKLPVISEIQMKKIYIQNAINRVKQKRS